MADPTPEERAALNLEAIKAREMAAPRGPWSLVQTFKNKPGMFSLLGHEGSAPDHVGRTVFGEIAHGAAKQVAVFVAHAREDVPALVAEVERLRADLAEARAQAFEEAAGIARKFKPASVSGDGREERLIQWNTAEEIAREIERARAKGEPRG